MVRNWRIGTALCCAASLLSGCVSMRPTMTSFSVDYNRVVADTRNRMILLNIVRAAYREPTYYTAFSQIEGSLNLQAGVSGSIANLAGGDATAFTPTVNGSITNAPTFTVVPLNSDEFGKGMLQPINSETIEMFLSQGWPPEFLAPLLVQRVECSYDDRVVAGIEIEPGIETAQVDAAFAAIRFRLGKPEPGTDYNFTVAAAEALKTITGGALDKFDVKLGPPPADHVSSMVTVSTQPERHLEAQVPDVFRDACRARFAAALESSPVLSRQFALGPGAAVAVAMQDKVTAGVGPARSPARALAMNIVFRSPDGIVYFLGKRLRAKLEGAPQAPDADGGTLFDVKIDAAGPAAVVIAHRGKRWSIPATELDAASARAPVDRSLEVIALINQLISVQTSLKEFSRAPASVRVR